jgi:hypothetical protein
MRYGNDYGTDAGRNQRGGMSNAGGGYDRGYRSARGGWNRGGETQNDWNGNWAGGTGGRGMNQGGMQDQGMRGGRGTGRETAFYDREGRYDTYSRRDFLTNQGDFSNEFGGGPHYGHHGSGRGRIDPPTGRGYSPGGMANRYDREYGNMDRMGGMDRGGMSRGGYVGADAGRGYGSRERISYGPHFGERGATTVPGDIARRNFERR